MWADFKSPANAEVIRASMGGPPESRNRVRMTTVTLLSSGPRVASNSMAGALSSGAVTAGTGATRIALPMLPAELRSSSIRPMTCSTGRIFLSMSRTVCGAAANHCCAGADR